MGLGIFNESLDDHRGQEIFRTIAYSPKNLSEIFHWLYPDLPEPESQEVVLVRINDSNVAEGERGYVSFKVGNNVVILTETGDFEDRPNIEDILRLSKKTLYELFQFLSFEQVKEMRFKLLILVRPTTYVSKENEEEAKAYMRQFPFNLEVNFCRDWDESAGKSVLAKFFDFHYQRIKIAGILNGAE